MNNSVKDLKLFLKLFKGFSGELFGAVILGSMTALGALGLLGLSGGFLTAAGIAGMAVATAEAFDIVLAPGAIRLFALMRTVGRWTERITSHEVTFRFLARLRSWLYGVFSGLSPRQGGDFHSAEILNRFTKDIDALENLTLRLIVPLGMTLVVFITLLILFGYQSPFLVIPLGVLAIFILIFLPLISYNLGKWSSKHLGTNQGRLRMSMMDTVDTLEDLSLHKLARLEQVDKVKKLNYARSQNLIVLNRRASGLRALVLFLTGLAALGVVVVSVGIQSLDGPWKAALVFLILGVSESVIPLPQAWLEAAGTLESAGRLASVAKQTPWITFPDHDVAMPKGFEIQCHDLRFHYTPDQPIMKNVTLTIPEGTHLAVTGPSGGGKSTFVKLLSRLEDPVSGALTMGGADFKNLSEKTLRTLIACAPQDPYLFRRPLMENLRLGAQLATDEALWNALEIVGLKTLVEAWPNGLGTWIEEEGANLSGGQRRRLVIARTLLADSKVVILDEPTEGLDETAAKDLSKKVRDLLKGKTLIWVTHRRPEIQGFDRELVLDQI